MFTSFSIYKILFVFEILVAELLFTWRLKRRNKFFLRFIPCSIALMLIAAFIPSFSLGGWEMTIIFTGLFFLTLPILIFSYEEKFQNIFFCALASYTTQHFAYGLANVALSLIVWGRSPILGMYDDKSLSITGFDKVSIFLVFVYLLCYVGSYWILYLIYGKRIKSGEELKIKNFSMLFLILAGLLADVVLNSITLRMEMELAYQFVIHFYNLLCCLLLLYGQFTLLYSKELENELATIRYLWYKEKEQYAITKDNIDLINMKCHDIKHQMRKIGRNQNIAPAAIKEIEEVIALYDTAVKTGNETLDIIFAEKSMRCYKEGILLSCIADGALLDFISEVDLYSIFGNALDNAIEATRKITEQEKRLIGIKIHEAVGMVTVNIKNSFSGEISFTDDGFPKTTKGDTAYHGYGIKSIDYIVHKYGGSISIAVEDGLFNLNILLPRKN